MLLVRVCRSVAAATSVSRPRADQLCQRAAGRSALSDRGGDVETVPG